MSNAVRRYVADPAERAVSTFVQQFVVILLATGSAGVVEVVQWGKAADIAALAAAVSVLTSVATFGLPVLPPGPDLVARVVKTGLQSFLAVLAADRLTPGIVDATWAAALAAAVPVMLFALLKGLAAMAAPWSEGAGLVPLPATAVLVASELASYQTPEPAGEDSWPVVERPAPATGD